MKKVVVLMGGNSSEYEISLLSGQEVLKNINTKKYEVDSIILPKGKTSWKEIIPKLETADCVFIAMHGKYGEDGRIQGLLDMLGIPYTGSGVLSSSLCMDKIRFRYIMESWNFTVPKFITISKTESISLIPEFLGVPPFFVKPYDQGSSVGCSLVENMEQLPIALKKSFKFSPLAIVDTFIEGLEVTCAVIGNKHPQALPIVEIRPKNSNFFDYSAKYEKGGSDEIVPATIDPALTKKVQDTAIEVYKLMSCRGFARVDFIISNGNLYILEVNTIPGLTTMSLFPKAAAAAGIFYSELIDMLIKYGLEEK